MPGTRWWHAVAIVVVASAAYAGSLDGAFVSDDHVSVERNAVIRGLDAAHLARIATTFDDANYIPVKVLTIAVDYRLWGLDPTGYHVTNVAIHAAAALVVYALLARMGLAPAVAVLAALAWAVHPVQVESVAWISERKNVLSGLLFLAAFHVYLGFSARPSAARYALVVLLYGLALLSKMNTVVLPAIVLAYEVAWRGRWRWRDGAVVLPLLALGAVVVWANLAGNTSHGASWHGGGPVVTWLSSAVVVWRYVAKLVWPVGLAARYAVPLYGSLLDPPVLAAVVGLAALGVAIAWMVATRRRAAFWLAWFVVCLAPMLNVIPFRSLMQDRYLYLPLLGPIALVAFALDARLRAPRARRLAGAAAVALLAVAGTRTVDLVEMWDSDFTLWQGEARTAAFLAPDPVYVPPEAEARRAYLRRALEGRPSSPFLRNNLAGMAYSAGRAADAVPGLEAAHVLAPEHPTILVNLGRAYARTDRPDDARRLLERAVARAPYDVQVHLALGRLLLSLGDAAGARRALELAASLIPPAAAAQAWAREWAALARLERAGS